MDKPKLVDVTDVEKRDQVAEEQAQGEQPFEMDAARAEEIAGGGMELQVPIKTLVLDGAAMRMAKDGDDRALLVGPIALNLVLPIPAEVARQMAVDLTGGIVIAQAGSVPKPSG